MFWQQLNLEDSLLNELVTKEDTTLDRVLEESDIIQECKTKNEKLLEFLCRMENMHQLIDYIISEPQDESDEKTKFYKSYISCELLSSDTTLITDTLANDSTLISQLWSFVRTHEEINPLLASFFSRVVQILLNRRPNLILEFLKDHPSLIDDLIFHIDTSAIMDLIYRIVICFENSITRFKVCHWLRDMRLVEKLVSSLSEEASSDTLCNTCHLLSDVIKVCRDPQESFKGAKDALLIELEEETTIQNIITTITSSKNKFLINHGVGVLQTYLTKPTPTSMVPNMTVEIDKPSIVSLESFNKSISANLEALQGLLVQPKGTAFRSDRLQIVKLIVLLVQCYSVDINSELVRLRTLEHLWKLFLQHPFNNFLHTQVVSMIHHILNTKIANNDDAILLNFMISDMKILSKIEDAWSEQTIREDHSNPCKKRVRRAGYLGHVYRIAYDVQEIITGKENKKYFQEWLDCHEDPQFWQTFFDETLKEQRKKNESDLGPDPRRYLHNIDSDDDSDDKIGIGLKNLVNNPLFTWKTDDDDDADFSFEPTGNDFSQVMDFKPVVVPEWKERNIEFWDKNIGISDTDGATSMQTQEGSSSSSEDEDIKDVHDPWASTTPQGATIPVKQVTMRF
ncbi:serine/threonine-protein phosphatase 6 regulatory subunit 3-like isoform X2 [Bolinopsis microptera]|uniref:serine/threonine-protein phosphatase 6 regulatory subunit 3-like isoform X2 n=1 Tax=Bolinopsis microptera TaxID=2820187 RepID=UPI0030796BC4